MAIVAIAADFENVFNSYVPAGKWILVAFSAAMFLMILIVLVEAVRSWIRLSNIPQDVYKRQEVHGESNSNNNQTNTTVVKDRKPIQRVDDVQGKDGGAHA